MVEPRELRPDEYKLVGSIIGKSFAGDQVNEWVFGGEVGIAAYYRLMAKKLFLKYGFGHVMPDGSGGTLWLPDHVRKHIPLWRSLDIAATMLGHGGIRSIRRGMALDNYLAAKTPQQAHYYLFAIGSLPQRQGKGIGGQLMNAGLARADAQRMPVYLESSKEANVPFYRRFGFEVIDVAEPPLQCPRLWLMWREARTA